MSPKTELVAPYASTPTDYPGEQVNLGEHLATLAESKWLILLVALLTLAAGVAYLLIAAPKYQVDALVQVEQDKNATQSLNDILAPLLEGETAVNAEIGILNSRLVLGKAVENLRLTISANPSYFPIIGGAIARRYDGEGMAAPWFGLADYAWGGETIRVQTFDVPKDYLDQVFTLEAGQPGRYRLRQPSGLFDADAPVILEGEVGKLAQSQLNGEPLLLFVTELQARPGTRFQLKRSDFLGAIADLQDALKIAETGKDSGLISLSLIDRDPVKAAALVNEIANIYLRQNVERRSAEAAQTLGFLEQQLPSLKKNMESAEAALNTYRQQKGSIDLPKEIEATLERIAQIEQHLLQLKTNREELLRRFKPAHPMVVALDAQMAGLNKELTNLNAQVKNLPDTEQEVVRLSVDARINTDLYTSLLNKAQELQVAKAGTLGSVRIVDYALAPIEPDSPKKKLTLLLAALLGLFLGVMAALLRRLLAGGVEDPEQVEKQTGLPVYATIPHSRWQDKLSRRLRSKTLQQAVLASEHQEDAAVESLRSLRATLHFTLMDASNNCLVITGPGPGVGKSFISVNLGAVLASAGKRVLLIDADLRKGLLNRYLGYEREPGLADFINGLAAIDQVIRHTAIPQLDFASTGTIPPNPAELLHHERFATLLTEMSAAYDCVLIDCAPVLAVADAIIVGRLAGATLLALKAGVHPMREIEQAIKRLRQGGVNLRGILFNNVKLTKGRYGYGYGKYVYQYSYKKT